MKQKKLWFFCVYVFVSLMIASSSLSVFALERVTQLPKEIPVTWFNPGAILSVEQNETALVIKTTVHKKAASFYITFPDIGGVRIYSDRTGFWNAESNDKISYGSEDGKITATAGKGTSVIVDNRSDKWEISVCNSQNNTVYSIKYNQISFGYDKNNEFKKVRLIGKISENEVIYGLGERFNSFDQKGAKIQLWNIDCYDDLISVTGDKTKGYKNIPILQSTSGYTLFFNSTYCCDADIAATNKSLYLLDFSGTIFDFYLWTSSALENIGSYTDLTGKPFLPPKWAFSYLAGNAQHVWNENGSEEENYMPVLKEYLENYSALGTPIAALYGELGVVQNKKAYELMGSQGTRVLGWQNSAMTQKEMQTYLPGVPASKLPTVMSIINPLLIMNGDYVDFTNPLAKTLYANYYKERWEWGLRGAMVDYADNIYEDSIYSNGMTGDEMHNLYPYFYNKTIYEAWRENLGDDFLLYIRAAAAGSQSYAACFAGDQPCTYQGLLQSLNGALNLSASGFSVWGSDIGGFGPIRTYPTPDLYIRWLQFGTFSPLMRSHGMTNRGPWVYGKFAENVYKEHYWLRENLVDFIYGKAIASALSGEPMMKAMALAYPEEKNALSLGDQYIFCDDLLVAPILKEDSSYRSVYFNDEKWINLWDGSVIEGKGESIYVEAPQNYIPVYIKGGSVIPVKISSTLKITDSMADGNTVNAVIVTPGNEKRSIIHYTDKNNAVKYSSDANGNVYEYSCEDSVNSKVILAYGIKASKVSADGKALEELRERPKGEGWIGYYVDYDRNYTIIGCESWNTVKVEDSGLSLTDYAKGASVDRSENIAKADATIDNDPSTSCTFTQKNGSSLIIDLGEEKIINSIVLKWAAQHADSYKISFSSNGNDWNYGYQSADSLGGLEKIEIEDKLVRYIKLSDVVRSDEYKPCALYSVEVFGKELTSGTEDENLGEQSGQMRFIPVIICVVVLIAVFAVAFVIIKRKKAV